MLQVIIPYIPQLAQLPSSMPLAAPLVPIRVTPLSESQPLAAQPPEEPPQPRSKLDHTPPRDVVRRPTSTPSTSARSVPDPDTLSSDSVDSLRVQLRMVNQRIDDVQKVIKTKNEHGESPLSGSPFILEIQDKPIPQHFRLRMLEAHDGGSDPIEHVTTFRAQMTLYDMSDAIMCWAFPMTLCWIAQGWYIRLPPALIHSFDQLVREFEANFLTSARPKPIVASLLRMRQKEDEPLNPYLARFTKEIRVIPDAHPSLVIQPLMIGIISFRFFWSLVERPLAIVPKML
ncbi:hypothetical protein BHE74_00041723 [Ensete ventricosum]|nr:hypothetical protein GW17_00037795 [Ensete ventricosum]RWW51891.1 hypothetical protein BHE74_00041723 [Ensete ventricosum]